MGAKKRVRREGRGNGPKSPPDTDIFGSTDPRQMPPHFFRGVRHMDYATAVRADVDQQNYCCCPRHWYVDAVFACVDCAGEFLFAAAEQRTWFEVYGFWVDAYPIRCRPCRAKSRKAANALNSLKMLVSGRTREPKSEVARLKREHRIATLRAEILAVYGFEPTPLK